MPINTFGYLLCMYVWLQTEAVCVCVCVCMRACAHTRFNPKWHKEIKSSGRVHMISSSLEFFGIQVFSGPCLPTFCCNLTLDPVTCCIQYLNLVIPPGVFCVASFSSRLLNNKSLYEIKLNFQGDKNKDRGQFLYSSPIPLQHLIQCLALHNII